MIRIPSAPGSVSAAALEAGRRTIERYARQAVPAFADFCLVHLASGRVIRCVAAVHSSRAGTRDVRALMTSHRIRRDDGVSTVAHVVRTGRPVLRTAIHPDPAGNGPAGRITDLHRRLAPASALVVPIRRHGVVVGAVSLCYSHSGRSYRLRDVPAAERFASRMADTLRPSRIIDATSGLQPAVRDAGEGAALRRRVAARDFRGGAPTNARAR